MRTDKESGSGKRGKSRQIEVEGTNVSYRKLKDELLIDTTVNNGNIKDYKYIFISPTKTLTSSTGNLYGGNYGAYGSTTSKSVNPSDVIAGILSKQGFIIVPELTAELANETLIVSYGESGRRNRGLGYTAESYMLICSGTAEGQRSTEADDIRQAVTRSLSAVSAR
jgi:hypothetical protein